MPFESPMSPLEITVIIYALTSSLLHVNSFVILIHLVSLPAWVCSCTVGRASLSSWACLIHFFFLKQRTRKGGKSCSRYCDGKFTRIAKRKLHSQGDNRNNTNSVLTGFGLLLAVKHLSRRLTFLNSDAIWWPCDFQWNSIFKDSSFFSLPLLMMTL